MPMIEDLRAGAVQHRAALVEDMDTEKGEMFIKAVPYSDGYTDIGAGIEERFAPGTFARSLKAPERLFMWSGHGGPVVGRGITAEERGDGVWLRMKVGRTQAAQEAMLNYADGIQSDPSIEFRPHPDFMRVEQRHGGGLRVSHRRAQLLGVAMVLDGAYHGQAYVESAREVQTEHAREEARLWFEGFKRGGATLR